MAKSKLYIRTLSTILSVLTIFPGIYKSYEVKAVKPGDKVQNVENTDKSDKGKKAISTSSSSSSREVTEDPVKTSSQSVAMVVPSSEEKAVATSNSQGIVTEELCKQASEIIECRSEQWVNIWTECLKHFGEILSFCEKEDREEFLSKEEKETLSRAFKFIISKKTIFPLQEEAVATVGPWGGIGLSVSEEIVTTYESLYKICINAQGKSSSGKFSSGISVFSSRLFGRGNPEPDDNDFALNAYKVFQDRMGKSATDENSIWYLTSRLQTLLSSRILALRDYGFQAINPLTAKILAYFQPVVNMASDPLSNLIGELRRGLTGAVNDSVQEMGNCLTSGGGARAIAKPIANEFGGALKNAATTSLDYAKTTALQTGAGLAGIFVASKLVCDLIISKIGSGSNNRNKQQQKQAVAENCEQPHKVENQ